MQFPSFSFALLRLGILPQLSHASVPTYRDKVDLYEYRDLFHYMFIPEQINSK